MTMLRCPHVVTLTADEHDRLDQLGGDHEIEWDLFCELQGRHPGPHVTLGQAVGDAMWFVRWAGDSRQLVTSREIVELECCPAESDVELCELPTDHAGGHSFELDRRRADLG